MEIRPMKIKDLAAVRGLEMELIQEYFGEILENKWEDLPQEWKDNLGASSKRFFLTYVQSGLSFVAVEDDEVLGFIFAQMVHKVYNVENMLWVENMGVHTYFRRMGIGYKLLQACVEEAKKQGAELAHSAIQPDNVPSIMLHKKIGYFIDRREIALLDLTDGKKHRH
ncbi:MAG: GNAT family N-acetyltransferase [Candidatus Methanomethylophilaceae archaeon]